MQLCGLYHWAPNVLKCSRAFCPRCSVCFSILITSLGEEGTGLCASCTFESDQSLRSPHEESLGP